MHTDRQTLAVIVFRLFLSFLGMVRDALAQRGQTQQDRVPLVCSRITKLLVRPVKPVQHSQHAVALIEPGEEHKKQPALFSQKNKALLHSFWSLFTISKNPRLDNQYHMLSSY